MAIKKLPERLRRWGWVRTAGAALTLAGTTVVFVILILPTSAFAGAAPYCAGDNTIRIFSFSPNGAKAGSDGSDSQITVLGANFQEEVTNLYIGLGKKQVEVSTWTSIGDNTILFNVPPGATTGKLVVASSSGNASCMAISKRDLRVG